MVRMYSRRLLSPYVGVIQVAELNRVQALSLDGDNWALRYALAEQDSGTNMPPGDDARVNYFPIGTIKQDRLNSHRLHPVLDPEEVHSTVNHLHQALQEVQVPFAARDRYEYWLLDSRDERPLALLQSSVDARDMSVTQPPALWLAMPAAQLDVQAPQCNDDTYVPPVNYRLQKLIEARAGVKPRALWFERTIAASEDFPPCLIREDWLDEQDRQLCDRYIERLAPRLLMMHHLPRAVRHRLEQAARPHVFDVERFHPLYPEVIDRGLITAARVEARMRRAAES